jgi:hypothetical protein
MKFNISKILTAVFIIFTVSLFVISFAFFPDGFVGTTRKGGVNLGCVCHGDTASPVVSVVINGPDSVAAGQTVTFSVRISQGPAIVGGFNVANARDGGSDTLTLNRITNDTMVKKQDGELTHTHPKPFVNDSVSWQFTYTANNTIGYDTLFATGNSTNNNNKSDSDKWNWSQNKNIRVYNPIGIINISSIAEGFSLSQNYPNPFNPVTQINFSVGKTSDIEIKVYDILGNVVSVLVNENLKQGEYKTDFNSAVLATGTYFYSLFANGEKISTKKMLILK